jgi:hypothetical protein
VPTLEQIAKTDPAAMAGVATLDRDLVADGLAAGVLLSCARAGPEQTPKPPIEVGLGHTTWNAACQAALSIDDSYVFRFRSFQNVGRGLGPSVPVALEGSSPSSASSAAESARVLVGSSETNSSSESRGATILRFSIS